MGTYEALTSDGDAAEHVVAFARRHEGRVVLAVVPRLGTALANAALAGKASAGGVPPRDSLPIGETVWGATTLILPTSLPTALPAGTGGPRYRNVVTGESVAVVEGRLRLADVFAVCPVAMLVADGP
ncbi:MAG: hypothetical protein HOP14_11270 [Acidobacteria bacterium]|nr:hypothetical protein [Acidobacteriota bacterium]